MKTQRSFSLSLVLAFVLAACVGEDGTLGLEEPLVARPAVFKKGKLPGAEPDGQPITEGPAVSFDISGRARQGASGLRLDGTANADTHSVGFRLAGEGTGYWVTTLGAEEIFVPGQFRWGTTFDLGFDLAPGPHELIAVGFDKNGKAGKQVKQSICVESDLFDNGNACDRSVSPPAAVAVLRWNTGVDLDLSVLSPASVRYDRSNFFQTDGDKTLAELVNDGTPDCQADGRLSETFVWHEQPPTGSWYFYVNLFDACGETSVSYELTFYRRKDNGDGTFSLAEERAYAGVLLRTQIDTGSENPLYLTSFKFP